MDIEQIVKDNFLTLGSVSKKSERKSFRFWRLQYRRNIGRNPSPPPQYHAQTNHCAPGRGVPQAGNRWRAANIRNCYL
jgi:hypothetical protein